LDAAKVLWACVNDLGSRGRADAALRVAGGLRSCFAADGSFKVQGQVAAALSLVAELQARDGRIADALGTYDDALALIAASDGLTRRGAGVALLLAKARVLATCERFEEAIVRLDGVFSAIKDAGGGNAAMRIRQAAVATVAKLDYLCALDRSRDARRLGEQLSAVLDQSQDAPSSASEAQAPVASESLLAATLGKLVNDRRCWPVFEGHESISPHDAAARAVGLYAISDPWAVSASATTPAIVAAALIRTIADGYALLSGAWTAAEKASLPLPHHAESERHALIQQHHVAAWAATEGHPLNLSVLDADSPQPRTSQDRPPVPSGTAVVSANVLRDLTKCLYLFEFASLLSRSASGREALRYKQLSAVSTGYLRFTVDWSRQISTQGDDDDGRVGVSIACWLIAQGLFAITHSKTGSTPQLFPDEGSLREFLHETGGYAWLTEHNVSMPAWTHAKDD
jgi:hypothetical protein